MRKCISTAALARTALIVEDDRAIAELITWALEDAGYNVRVAPTIAEAMSSYDQSQPDLVVADLLLPDGMGSDIVRRIHEEGKSNPAATLMMSAHPRAEERAEAAGADACLKKPFDLGTFYETVERLTKRDL